MSKGRSANLRLKPRSCFSSVSSSCSCAVMSFPTTDAELYGSLRYSKHSVCSPREIKRQLRLESFQRFASYLSYSHSAASVTLPFPSRLALCTCCCHRCTFNWNPFTLPTLLSRLSFQPCVRASHHSDDEICLSGVPSLANRFE